MSRILLTAYAVNPYKGSEDGVAWHWIQSIKDKGYECLVITRKNNRPAIEKFLVENKGVKDKNLVFYYFDLPYFMRFWKRGGRGAMLYFYLWQIGILFFIKQKKIKFDIAHNLNFINDWIPTFLWLLGKPTVWGPVGHHHNIPRAFLSNYTKKELLFDRLKGAIKAWFWYFSPWHYLAQKNVSKIIGINSSVNDVMKHSKKIVTIPSVASEYIPFEEKEDKEEFTIISIGRFVPLKGFDVTLRAFAHFVKKLHSEEQTKVKLEIIGKGPEASQLKALTHTLGIASQVNFIDWMPRQELHSLYLQADTFLFPSHEGAGMVVPEALSYGLPVLCFDNYGPGELVGEDAAFLVPYGKYEDAIVAFSEALRTLFFDKNKRKKMSLAARKRFENHLQWKHKGALAHEIYQEILGQSQIISPKTKTYAEA